MRRADLWPRCRRALHDQVAPTKAYKTRGVGAAFGMHVLDRGVRVIRVHAAIVVMMMLCILPVLDSMA